MKALVTGAGGFLGHHVVAELLKRGRDVRAMVRPSSPLDGPGWPGPVEVVRADLTVDDLDAAFDGVDVLIHLAAAMRGTAREQDASTVGGTGRLLDSMGRSRARRLVLVSSLSVYDWSSAVGELTEDSPLEENPGRRDAYASAKSEQERLVRREAAAKGWALTVLRPGYIWGRGHADLAGLGQKVGPLRVVIGPSTRLPLTHVENCASCCVEAAENPRAVGETFNVVDDEGPTVRQYLDDHLRGTGRKGFRLPIPYGPAFAAVMLAHGAIRALSLGRARPPSLLVPCRFEARFKPLRFTNRKLVEGLGWSPPLDRAGRLRRTYGPGLDGPSAFPGPPSGASAAAREAPPR